MLYMAVAIMGLIFFVCQSLFIQSLYYIACYRCGGNDAKPHTRYEIMRLTTICIMILTFYFINGTGKIILFLLINIVVFMVNCVSMVRLMPYYNMTMCMFRQATIVAVTSAIFCCLIGEFF